MSDLCSWNNNNNNYYYSNHTNACFHILFVCVLFFFYNRAHFIVGLLAVKLACKQLRI